MDYPTISLDDFLSETFSQEFLDEAAIEYALTRIAARANAARAQSALSFRQIARRMNATGPAIVQRIVNEGSPHNVTVATLVRFAHACGFDLNVDFTPKQRTADWMIRPSSTRSWTANGSRVTNSGAKKSLRESRPPSTPMIHDLAA